MPVEKDVIKIRSKLEKMISNSSTDHCSSVDILKSLQDLPMNFEVLQKTKIGLTVNNFRKASRNNEVISLSKNLIKFWKKLLPDSTSKPDIKKEKPIVKNGESKVTAKSKMTDIKSNKQNSTTAPDTNDPVRLKCRVLLCSALKTKGSSGHLNPDDVAAQIEDNIFQEFKNTDMKYKNRVRSRVANLKDTKNPDLRNNVLTGIILADRIAKMTAEEMASKEMTTLRAKYTKEAIDDHQIAKVSGTTSDLFRCSKCGKNNCSYSQIQILSADEPMTTFVQCHECGKRWKFC